MFCENHSTLIPLTFVLAFYVSHVVSRWWAQWNAIPWPDGLAFKINSYCSGLDENTRLVRRTVTRYACLAIVDTLRMVSSPVKKRFPTYSHLVEAGLMTEDEMQAVLNAQSQSDYMNYIYWMPLSWASHLTVKAYEQGYILKARYVSDLNNELSKLRFSCGTVISYDWVSLPLVYTQVVTLAVYTFFGASLLGRQWLDPQKSIEGYASKNIDYVVPIFTVLQFLFYVGWLKVAEALLNPYGEDDEDFDTNWMVDRHLQAALMMVDTVGQHPPKLERDIYWDVGIPDELPYTVASLPFRMPPAQTSAEDLHVPIQEQQPIYPQYLEPNEKQASRKDSTKVLNLAISNVLQWAATPIMKRRSSKTMSIKSNVEGTRAPKWKVNRQLASCTSSPRFAARKEIKSRSHSFDNSAIPGFYSPAMTPIEPSSRKTSTKSDKSQLTPVFEDHEGCHQISIVVPQLSRLTPPPTG